MKIDKAIDVLKNLAFLSGDRSHEECEEGIKLAIQALEKQKELQENCEGSCSDCKYRGEFKCANNLLIDAGEGE